MRKLMEAVQLNEYFVREGETFKDVWIMFFSDLVNDAKIFQNEGESEAARQFLAVSKEVAPLKQKIKPLLNTPLPIIDSDDDEYWDESPISKLDRLGEIVSSNDPTEDGVLSGIIEAFYEAYYIIGELADEALNVNEANQGGKTEHSGAKHGKGAYYGRKKEAKRDSNKNRRNADKFQSKEITEITTGYGIEEDFNPRESTVALHELMDEGILDARTVADACLNYMSEADVEDMAESNYFFGDN